MGSKNKTLVIGASIKPIRYSNKAIRLLQESKIPHYAIGLREGTIEKTKIEVGYPNYEDVDTITLYIGPSRQNIDLMKYFLQLKPRRVIFNPGTEHPEHIKLLKDSGIMVELACTLVLIRTNQY